MICIVCIKGLFIQYRVPLTASLIRHYFLRYTQNKQRQIKAS